MECVKKISQKLRSILPVLPVAVVNLPLWGVKAGPERKGPTTPRIMPPPIS
jgi:hypothetical protein